MYIDLLNKILTRSEPLVLIGFHLFSTIDNKNGGLGVMIAGPYLSKSVLGEIAWFPTAWFSDYIRWEAIDAQSAKVTITHQDILASAILSFNDMGQITELKADRYLGKQLEQWSGRYEEYQEVDGILIPTKVEVTWNLPSGDYSYFQGEITEIEYNCTTTY